MTTTCRFVARLRGPVAVAAERGVQTPTTLRYLPGSTLRGALAARYLRLGGAPEDELFRQAVLGGSINFPDLRPVDHEGELGWRMPMTTSSCKRKRGFRRQGGHGVRDTLPLRILEALGGESSIDARWRCRVDGCGLDLKPFGDFWNGDLESPRHIRVSVGYRMHVGIEPVLGSASPGVIYGLESISPHRVVRDDEQVRPEEYPIQLFAGCTQVSPADAELVRRLVGGAGARDTSSRSSATVFVGSDRARGYGEIALEVSCQERAETKANSVRERVHEWNRQLLQALGGKGLPVPASTLFIVLGLQSPAIFVDRFLRPTFSPPLPLPLGRLEPLIQMVRPALVRGWNAAAGLPKADDPAVAAGSVYAWRVDEESDALWDCLDRVERQGIGLRTIEGYGEVRVNDPAHLLGWKVDA